VKRSHMILWVTCLVMPWASLHADSWGQLFTTPTQRAQLDSEQTTPVNTIGSSNPGSSGTSQAPAIETIQLTGTITSSRGTHTVWLNGKPVTQGVRVLGPGRVQLNVNTSDHPHLMKSGQLIYPQSGEIVEGYANRQSSQATVTVQTGTESADTPM